MPEPQGPTDFTPSSKTFTGATVASAMSGQAPAATAPIPMRTETERPPPEEIPVTRNNQHLVIGAPRPASEVEEKPPAVEIPVHAGNKGMILAGPASAANPPKEESPAPVEVAPSAPSVGTSDHQVSSKGGPLPVDFPGFDAFAHAREATFEAVQKRIDEGTLTKVLGIGMGTAERIKEAMKH